jgi:predicted ATPase/serine/threonine protein kinase/Tfp pilus assembly protein PilF
VIRKWSILQAPNLGVHLHAAGARIAVHRVYSPERLVYARSRMRRCPKCERLFADETTLCPDDATTLPPPDPLVGTVLDGKYRIDGVVGEGGMGTVYRATQLNLHRPVAIKVIRGDFLEDPVATARFKREALAVAQVKHPHIVTVLDFGVAPEAGAYLVLEFLDGCTLRERLDCEGPMPLRTAVSLTRQVCSAVHLAHTAGIIHRDLKPENIFLEGTASSPSAKVLDFGVAKVSGREGGALRGAPKSLTISGVFVGTPTYMSPEQCESGELDARSDVYSLGCVLYEMLTGRPPFSARSLIALLNKHVSDPPVPPGHLVSGLPFEIEAAVMRALAKLPEERFQTAAEFAASIGIETEPQRADATFATITGTFYHDTAQQLAMRTHPEGGGATAPATPRHNLPSLVTSFVGRDREIGEIHAALATSRLVTLVGPGGMGKTRLSLQVALRALPDFRDGVWLVELASATDAGTATKAVASALGIREETDRALLGTLVSALATKRMLVVLDNCEHVVGSCADLAAAILGGCPGVHLLASSQDILGVAGENVRRIDALSTPPAETPATPRAVLEYEAVRLFVERSRLAAPQFAVTEKNAGQLAELCRRLDGIPLAVELAAARARMLSVEQILERLDDRFRILTGGGRTAPARHHTLRATMDWSHALLEDAERILFRRLSVFVAGWSLEAAEKVTRSLSTHDEFPGAESDHLIETLTRLVDRSLVVVDKGDEVRFRMLETIRQYALERLRASGEERAVRDAHRDWCVTLAETESRNLRSDAESAWLARLETEHDNLRAALVWSAGDGWNPEALARTAAGLGWFWSTRGHWSESRRWFDAALSSETAIPKPVFAKLLYWSAILDMNTGDIDRAKARLEACLPLWRELDDRQRTATTLYKLGEILASRGDYEAAIPLQEESLAISEALGDRRGVAYTVSLLGLIAMDRGDFDEAIRRYETCLGICRAIDDMRGVAGTLHNLGEIAGRRGDLDRAESLLAESLAVAREFGYKHVAAASMQVLGNVANDRGQPARALEYFDDAMILNRSLGNRVGVAYVLEGIACSAAALGRPRRALRLVGSAQRLREKMASPLSASERLALDRYLDVARAAISAEDAAAEIDEGRAMAADEAIALALGAQTPWSEP